VLAVAAANETRINRSIIVAQGFYFTSHFVEHFVGAAHRPKLQKSVILRRPIRPGISPKFADARVHRFRGFFRHELQRIETRAHGFDANSASFRVNFVRFVSGTEYALILLNQNRMMASDSSMNTQPIDLRHPLIAATHAEPSKLLRLGMFVFLTLPGAWLVATFGSFLGAPETYRDNAWVLCLCALGFLAGAALVLAGTRTTAEPLFLLVFAPMPVLISLGFHLGYLGIDAGFPIAVLGMMWPMITYRPVSRYYKRRATKAAVSISTQEVDRPQATTNVLAL